jgi:hypothetical protein
MNLKGGIKMKKVAWWDMDGTLAATYDVENWLPKLRASDPSPYIEAKVMWNMSLLARYMNQLQQAGYKIGVISWLAKDSTTDYDEAVKQAKLDWLQKHLHSVQFDYIEITEYGKPKQDFMKTEHDILFDDNEEIRNAWTGSAYEPSDILSVLKELLHQE